MDWLQILMNGCTILAIMGGSFAWLWSRLDKKFEAIDKKFEVILSEIKEIRFDLHKIDTRLSRLETQDEERFRNEIKLLISKKENIQ